MSESVLDILREVNPDAVPAEAPPAAANYRPADVQGIACATCVKFKYTGEVTDQDGESVPAGYCSQWEANVVGDHVSDGYAGVGPAIDENGDEVWDFADDDRSVASIHFSGGDVATESGFVVKEILRTGEWPAIPTNGGVIKKPLRIVRDGRSSKDEGVIALSEIVENFYKKAIENVQIPLSDDEDDHKNITRVNTGFVRDIWIKDREDGSAVLMAKMEFTEPDVKEKVLRGTYTDVSCAIPWQIQSRGQKFGAVLEHCAITNRPFIDGLGPFVAMSDQRESANVIHFSNQIPAEIQQEHPILKLGFSGAMEKINSALVEQLQLSRHYRATDINDDGATVVNEIAQTTWTVPFEVDDEGSVTLAAVSDWTVEEEGEKEEPPAHTSGGSPRSSDDELDQARVLREIRLSGQPTTKRAKEGDMPQFSREDLDRLELSDEARAAVQDLLEENSALRATTRENEVSQRIAELEELGLKDRPGALKFYRQIFLSDDGGPAVVLLSDNGQEKQRLTALEVLDNFIEAIKGSDGKVVLSDQHLASGNDDPPPPDAEGEKPLKDRVAEAKTALYG